MSYCISFRSAASTQHQMKLISKVKETRRYWFSNVRITSTSHSVVIASLDSNAMIRSLYIGTGYAVLKQTTHGVTRRPMRRLKYLLTQDNRCGVATVFIY